MPSVGAKALRAVFGAAESAGVDAQALARAHGLTPDDLLDPDLRVPYLTWLRLWDEVKARSGDPGIGLHAAEALGAGYWDVIDFVAASSDTLRDGLARFVRYFSIISTGIRHELIVGPREARLLRQLAPGALESHVAAEFGLANVVLRFRRLTAQPWNPSHVAFTHAAAAPLEDYARVFRSPVRFGRAANEIVLPLDALDLPMRGAAPELCAVLERHAVLLVEKLPAETASSLERVEHALTLELRGGAPTLASVAKRLGTTERTLQRRLGEHGVSFRVVVEQTRERLARRYLSDATIGLGEVAFLVGFSDASAFYKAFRRWTGLTPGEFRERSARARRAAGT